MGENHVRGKGRDLLIDMGVFAELDGAKVGADLYIRQAFDGHAIFRYIFPRLHVAQVQIVHISLRGG